MARSALNRIEHVTCIAIIADNPQAVDHFGLSLGQCTCLIENNSVYALGDFKTHSVTYQYALLGTAPHTYHQSGGCGKSERTRTGYNQHRYGRQYSVSDAVILGKKQPQQQRDDRQAYNNGDKYRRNLVDNALYRRLGALRLLNQGDYA